jgi:hypothetical protein
MKTKKLGRMVLKEEFFAITGCLEEAIILNQMCYWSERIKEIDKFLEEEYTMLVDHVPVLAHGWIYKSASELVGEMFGAVSEKTMNRILDKLVKKNFLRRRVNPNPKYKFDKTYHYRVNFVEIILKLRAKGMPLSGYQVIEECADRLERNVAPKRHFDGSEDQVDVAIPETITETKNKETPIVPNGDTGLLFDTEQSSVPSSPMIANRSAMASRSKAIPENIAVFQTRANRLLGRRDSTKWATNEIKAAANWLDTTEEEWKLLEGFYANRGKEGYYCRTNMLTLLNNWSSEIDKARSKQTTHEEESWKPTTI